MKLKINLKIKEKLSLGFAFVLIILIGLGFYSNYLMKIINNQSTVIVADKIPSINVAHSLNTMTSDFRILELGHVIADTPEAMDKQEQAMTEKNKQIQDDFNKYAQKIDNSEEQALFNQVKTNWDKYLSIDKQILSLSRQMKTDEAMALLNGDSKNAFDTASNALLELVQYNMDDSNKASTYGDQLFAQSSRNQIIIIVVSVLLVLLIIFSVAKSITKPISVLKKELDTLAQNGGDLTQKIIVNSKDEIGELASSVNKFLSNLREIVKQISGISEQLASSSEELTASSEQQAQATNQVAVSIQEVAAGTEKQNTAINETSTAVEQISAAIQEVAANSNEVAEQATQTSNTAKEGQASADNAVNQMHKVGEETVEIQKAIEHLAQGSTKIGEITDTITAIAAQTNLLALNAAIEAARAGEQGRGFAVVAEEVRKLAEQSSAAAEQISSLINENQRSFDNVVETVRVGSENVTTGINVVGAAGEMFVKISDSINQVVNQIQEVSATIEEMASGSQQIVSSIKKIDNISKENMVQSETVSAATEEQSASVEQIASASQSLATMAQNLQAIVNKFRV